MGHGLYTIVMPSGKFPSSTNGLEQGDKGVFAVIIPVYNHGSMLLSVVEKACKLDLPVIVVDDGSTDAGADGLNGFGGVEVLRHRKNRGKGAAILTGFDRAAEIADWAITMDADGQHHPADALALIEAIPEKARPLVVGARQGMGGENVPWTSRFGRKFSNFWIRVSGGPAISDTQSGFRIYPLPECMALKTKARRYQFELEMLVKAHWSNMPVVEVPVKVTYPERSLRTSHFRPFVDFMRNARMFCLLIMQRLLIRPFKHE